MFSPCAKASAAPGFMLGPSFSRYRSPCPSSGVSTMTTSAHLAHSAGSMTRMPAASAFGTPTDPLRSPTASSVMPLSFKLVAWAWPWLP